MKCSRPSIRRRTRPALSSTFRCFETALRLIANVSAMSPTRSSPASRRISTIRRRERSDSAWNIRSSGSGSELVLRFLLLSTIWLNNGTGSRDRNPGAALFLAAATFGKNRVGTGGAGSQARLMSDYERIARIIQYLDRRHVEQPDLDALARVAGLSRFHFHRLFVRWAGTTPKEFLQCLTMTHVRRLLAHGESVLDTALEAGLSGPGRLHDLTILLEAASPGELKSGGANWIIRVGHAPTPFGVCLLGEGPRGVCELSFVESRDRVASARAVSRRWPAARLEWDESRAEALGRRIFRVQRATDRAPLRAHVRGTPFQVRVWRALLRVPPGVLVSYGDLARAVGDPRAARAVGAAVGSNPIAFLIPCHRVIRQTGVIGEYRWGATRKRALLAWEAIRIGDPL